jgi:hypothetical protein
VTRLTGCRRLALAVLEAALRDAEAGSIDARRFLEEPSPQLCLWSELLMMTPDRASRLLDPGEDWRNRFDRAKQVLGVSELAIRGARVQRLARAGGIKSFASRPPRLNHSRPGLDLPISPTFCIPTSHVGQLPRPGAPASFPSVFRMSVVLPLPHSVGSPPQIPATI